MDRKNIEERLEAAVERVEEATGVSLASVIDDFSADTMWIRVWVKDPADIVDLRKVTGKLTREIKRAFPGAEICREGSPVKGYYDRVFAAMGDPFWEDSSYLFTWYGWAEYSGEE